MSRQTPLLAKDIIVGKALPFSVYGADNTLLLAKGQVVSERIREALLRNGVRPAYRPEEQSEPEQERIEVPETCPLQAFRNAYARVAGSTRVGFRMSRDDRGESYTAWVIGTHEQRGLMLSAPMSRDNSLVAMADGQTWIFRAFHGTAAFRFSGIVRKVMFDPIPYFHLQLPPTIDMRHVRQRPRAQVCLPAAITLNEPQQGDALDGVICDLSSCGLRLALKQSDVLQKQHSLHIRFSVPLLEKSHDICRNAWSMNSMRSGRFWPARTASRARRKAKPQRRSILPACAATHCRSRHPDAATFTLARSKAGSSLAAEPVPEARHASRQHEDIAGLLNSADTGTFLRLVVACSTDTCHSSPIPNCDGEQAWVNWSSIWTD